MEIGILYSLEGWSVFKRNHQREGKGIKGNPPEEFYRIYSVEQERIKKVWRALTARATFLEDQRIVPSKENYDKIFPDLTELIVNS